MIYLKLEGTELRVSLSTISLLALKSFTRVDRESLVKAQPILQILQEMSKSTLVFVTLASTFVAPSLSCSFSSGLNSCNELIEKYQMFTRTKAAAGESI